MSETPRSPQEMNFSAAEQAKLDQTASSQGAIKSAEQDYGLPSEVELETPKRSAYTEKLLNGGQFAADRQLKSDAEAEAEAQKERSATSLPRQQRIKLRRERREAELAWQQERDDYRQKKADEKAQYATKAWQARMGIIPESEVPADPSSSVESERDRQQSLARLLREHDKNMLRGATARVEAPQETSSDIDSDSGIDSQAQPEAKLLNQRLDQLADALEKISSGTEIDPADNEAFMQLAKTTAQETGLSDTQVAALAGQVYRGRQSNQAPIDASPGSPEPDQDLEPGLGVEGVDLADNELSGLREAAERLVHAEQLADKPPFHPDKESAVRDAENELNAMLDALQESHGWSEHQISEVYAALTSGAMERAEDGPAGNVVAVIGSDNSEQTNSSPEDESRWNRIKAQYRRRVNQIQLAIAGTRMGTSGPIAGLKERIREVKEDENSRKKALLVGAGALALVGIAVVAHKNNWVDGAADFIGDIFDGSDTGGIDGALDTTDSPSPSPGEMPTVEATEATDAAGTTGSGGGGSGAEGSSGAGGTGAENGSTGTGGASVESTGPEGSNGVESAGEAQASEATEALSGIGDTEAIEVTDSLSVPQGEGFENTLQQQYGLTDTEASEAFTRMRPHLEGQPGTYLQGTDLRISNPGEFILNEEARRVLEEYLESIGKKVK